MPLTSDIGNVSPYVDVPSASVGGDTTLPWSARPSDLGTLREVDSITVIDASGDDSQGTVFRNGAIRVDASAVRPPAAFDTVFIEAVRGGVATTLWQSSGRNPWRIGSDSLSGWKSVLVDLSKTPTINGGDYEIRLRANLVDGGTYTSRSAPMRVQTGPTKTGTLQAETFSIAPYQGEATVVVGGGGTDVFELTGVTPAKVASINGLTYSAFFQLKPTSGQAIYRGSTYDCLRLTDGREVYFQGIERLRFDGGIEFSLTYKPNDPQFSQQWNLHVTDVPGAWRYTKGATSVLLASLDTGLLSPNQRQIPNSWYASGKPASYIWTTDVGGIHDMNLQRMITDATDDDNTRAPNYYGHGHAAMSVMSAAANNGTGIAGINWNSSVLVADIYGRHSPGGSGVTLQQAIQTAITQARSQGLRVVFQGGLQGEMWLNDGGTAADLQKLFSDNADVALFAIAAGNGGQDMRLTTGDESAGVSRLSATYGNVISVGAVERAGFDVYAGLHNAFDVTRATYSNFGPALTLTAPVDVPAMDKYGATTFDGTSCANPHVAGIASLVWSVNSNLRGDEVRQILIDTATDVGAAGRDNDFGHGLVNADAAVRRAVALARDEALALLVPMGDSSPQLGGFSTDSPFSSGSPVPPAPLSSPAVATRFATSSPGRGLTPVTPAPVAADVVLSESAATETPWCAVACEQLAASRVVRSAIHNDRATISPSAQLERGLLDYLMDTDGDESLFRDVS
jgi:hypothetical protein